jgi:glycosyltransferase involved in cell wall biosynthesis
MPKRILICGVQVPFTRGGAEGLIDGLAEALRAAGHTVDVAALPFNWSPKSEIMRGALAWRLLDLRAVNGQPIDQVICTKFPSYAVKHPHKVVWLVHQHRQAYDWYGTPYSDFVNTSEDRQLREQIVRLDRATLSEARRLYTISGNVSARLRRFSGLDSTALYPPSRIAQQLREGSFGDYVLSVARLDGAKRVHLLVDAIATTRTARAVIVGDGPEREALIRLAQARGLGARVRFEGFVGDERLVELYAGCRAVFYAPVDEDYGFATVEAFGAGKPVISAEDSGFVREFVRDGETGLIAPPVAAAFAARIETLLDDASLAARLGAAGKRRARGISWQKVVEALVLPASPNPFSLCQEKRS